MGCVCCSLSSFVSIVLDALERVSLCTVCAMLSCCIMITILTVSMMSVGIGYHYCYVQKEVGAMAEAARAAGSWRSGSDEGSVLRSAGEAFQRGLIHRMSRRDMVDQLPPDYNNQFENNTVILNENTTTVFNITNFIMKSNLSGY